MPKRPGIHVPRSLVAVSPTAAAAPTLVRVASFNVLAQKLIKRNHYPYCSTKSLRWPHRRVNLLREVQHLYADIIAFQEMDFYKDYWVPELSKLGYESVFLCKNPEKEGHGCAIFYRKDKFEQVGYAEVELAEAAKEYKGATFEELDHPNVAQMLSLRMKPAAPAAEGDAKSESKADAKSDAALGITVSNTHLYWHPRGSFVRLNQAAFLLRRLMTFSKEFGFPVAMCGDFNTTPDGHNYHFLTKSRSISIDGEMDTHHMINLMWLLPMENESLIKWCEEHKIPFGDYDKIKQAADNPEMRGRLQRLLAQSHHTERLQSIRSLFERNRDLPFLQSAYADYQSIVPQDIATQESKYWKGEPPYTNYRHTWFGTLDYIFTLHPDHAELGGKHALACRNVLEIPREEIVTMQTGLPNDNLSSDHVSILAEFEFVPTESVKPKAAASSSAASAASASASGESKRSASASSGAAAAVAGVAAAAAASVSGSGSASSDSAASRGSEAGASASSGSNASGSSSGSVGSRKLLAVAGAVAVGALAAVAGVLVWRSRGRKSR